MCARCATPTYLEGKELEFKVIKLDQRRNNVVVSRRAVVETEYERRTRSAAGESAGRRRRQGHRQEPDRLRRVRRPGRHRWSAAYHRYGLETRQASVRDCQRRRRNRRQGAQVRPRAQPRLAGSQAAGPGSVGRICAPLSGKHPPVRQGHQHRRLWLFRGNRRRCRGPGARLRDGLDQQERPSLQGGPPRRRSRGHGAGYRRGAPPHLAGHEAVPRQPLGRVLRPPTTRATTSRATSSPSPISASSSAWTAVSTAWSICPTSPGTRPGEEAVRNYKKGDEMEAVVLAVDAERERISLGDQADREGSLLQLRRPSTLKGSVVKGVIREVDAKGAVVDLGDGVEGTCVPPSCPATASRMPAPCLRWARKSKPSSWASTARTAHSSLSIKAKDSDEEAAAIQDFSRGAAPAGTKLGDVLKEQMENNGD